MSGTRKGFNGSTTGVNQSLYHGRAVNEYKRLQTSAAQVAAPLPHQQNAALPKPAPAPVFPKYAVIPPPRYNDVDGTRRLPTVFMILPPPRYGDKDGIPKSTVVELKPGLGKS